MSLLLGLLLCLHCCSAAPAERRTGGAPLSSLRVNITITPISGPWQLFCVAKVEVHGEPCFSYDCWNKELTPICVHGKKVAARLRVDLREILKHLMEKFKEKLLDVDPVDSPGSGPLSLQATLVIQEEASGRSRGSWQLIFSGRISLHLDLVTRAWTAGHPGDRWMLANWEEDTDMNVFLWKTSYRQWRMWLQEVAAHWGMLGNTDLSPTAPLLSISVLLSPGLCLESLPFYLSVLRRSPHPQLLRDHLCHLLVVPVTLSLQERLVVPLSTTPGTSGGKSTMQELWVISGMIFAFIILSVSIIRLIKPKRLFKEWPKVWISAHTPF